LPGVETALKVCCCCYYFRSISSNNRPTVHNERRQQALAVDHVIAFFSNAHRGTILPPATPEPTEPGKQCVYLDRSDLLHLLNRFVLLFFFFFFFFCSA
jgi:hypothetical protein